MGGWKDGDAAPMKEAQPTRTSIYVGRGESDTPTPVQGNYWVKFDAYEALRAELVQVRQSTNNLLAVIFRDGGQRTSQHATTQGACTEAEREIVNLFSKLEASEAREKRVREALEKLIAKLDLILPQIDAMCVMESIHGRPYTGPNLVEELAEARRALEGE